MTTSFIRHALILSSFALVSQAHALVEAGHWNLYSSVEDGVTTVQTTIDQTPDGDFTGIMSKYAGGVLTGVTYNVDQGSDLFVVQKGAIFSNETVVSQSLPFIHGVSVEWGLSTQSAVVGQDFYLGARTRTDSEVGHFDTFGWAHVKVDALGQFQLLDSAVAFNEGGIVVGTLQAVPEPSTIALMGIGLAGVACTARQRRRRSIA